MSNTQEDGKSVGSRKSGKLHSAIEQAQAIQQREQLRVMIVDKFNKDFSKGNKNITKLIEEQVADYFSKEKVTEESLRVLKTRVAKAVEDYRKDSKSCISPLMQKRASSPSPLSRRSSSATLTRSVPRHPRRSPATARSNLQTSSRSVPELPLKPGTPLLMQFRCFQICLPGGR